MDLPDPDSEEEEPPSEGEREPEGGRLWMEYDLIQSKIDKIGEFQFKVKSWSVTLFGAVLFGGAATPGATTSRLLLTAVSAFILAAMFHLSERRQRQISQRLSGRASALERAFSELPPVANAETWRRIQHRIPSLRSVPGIAACIIGEKGDKWKTEWLWKDRRAILRWLVNHSDDAFYVAQYVLAVGLFILTATLKAYEWLKH
jgi:hypothetical protein